MSNEKSVQTKRGSEFRKWDLHLHSCHSYLNNQFASDETGKKDENLFIETVKSSGLSAIGLTNYFNFEEADFELKKKLEEKGIVTFLNLEVRLFELNKSDDLLDYHIIFDNTLEDKIIKNLLGELKAVVGGKSKAFNNLDVDEIDKRASIQFNILCDTLKGIDDLQGRYLTGFLSRGHGSATSDGDAKNMSVYEHICVSSDFIIHSSCNDSQNCKDKRCKHNNLENDRIYWLNKSKHKKPLLQSSDAHKLEDIGSKYSWIKSDLTFNGLRQICFEPEDRISLKKDHPDTKLDYQVIDFIDLGNSRKIYLNSALNTVIGSRSTGKSTLTNSIAKSLKNSRFTPIEKGSNRGMHVFDQDVNIGWRDKQEHQDLEFLPQDYMIQIAEDDRKRNDLIKTTVQSDLVNYTKINNFDENKRKIQNEINNLIHKWTVLKEQLSNLMKPEGDKKGIETQLEKLTKQISEQEKKVDFSEQDSTEYKVANEKLSECLSKVSLFENRISDLKELFESEISLSIAIPQSNDEFSEELSKYVDLLKSEVNEKWKLKIEELKQSQQKLYENSIEEVQSIRNSEAYTKGKNSISNNETLKNLTNIQKEEKKKLEEFIKFESKKKTISERINDVQNEIIETYGKFNELRNILKEEFLVKATPVEIKIDFQSVKFEDKINYLNARNTNNNKFIEEFDLDPIKAIKTIFDDLNLSYNQRKTQEDLIKDVLSQDWFVINYVLQYDSDNFEQMSQGKKAFVILSLILEFSKDKKPVIIDQPEDSLDNRAIYNDLTDYLKRKKRERQIILVTHNPNIVVGADAENVIVANQHSGDNPNVNNEKFDYVNGALEETSSELSCYTLKNKGIREHVLEILEGGRDAFDKREQKYKKLHLKLK